MNSLQFFLTSADQRCVLNTTLRSLLAIVGGYWVAALSAATLALGFRYEGEGCLLAAMMASFVVYCWLHSGCRGINIGARLRRFVVGGVDAGSLVLLFVPWVSA
jgi:hypothetical protein